MHVIGIHGYARSGKDTIAGFLGKSHGFRRLAFADRLRECTYALNPVITWETPSPDQARLQEIVDEIGWDEAKVKYAEIRRLLQAFGTEVGRELIRDSLWVDIVLDQMYDAWDQDPDQQFVITDLRFPNEVEALRSIPNNSAQEVELWKVVRPGVGPVNGHASDAGLEDDLFDVVINNHGTLEDLEKTVNRYANPADAASSTASTPADETTARETVVQFDMDPRLPVSEETVNTSTASVDSSPGRAEAVGE